MNYIGTTSETTVVNNNIFGSILTVTSDRIEEPKTKAKLPAGNLEFPKIYLQKPILVASRNKDRERMLNAAKKQEEIKREYGIPEEHWNSLSELRKWRSSH